MAKRLTVVLSGVTELPDATLREVEADGGALVLRFGPYHDPMSIVVGEQAREIADAINEGLGKHYQPWPERVADEAPEMETVS